MPREPQSYGSGSDWVTGRTDQQVTDQDSSSPPDDRRDSEHSSPAQGGQVSDFQLAENAQPTGATSGEHDSVSKVTSTETGAKRDSFFKKRDYE